MGEPAFNLSGFYQEACISCGVLYCIPSGFRTERLRDHANFYCPNGHPQHYTAQTEAERLRQELEREQRRHAFTTSARDQARREAETNERRRRGEKAAKTRVKNRVARGQCPCCAEVFADLHAHMAAKHPAFGDEEIQA